MKVTLHWEGDVLIARLAEMDLATNGSLAETLHIITETQPQNIVLDCSGVAYIASTGIANLIKFIQQIRHRGATARLAALQPRVQRLLDLVHLRRWVRCSPTLPDALQLIRQNTSLSQSGAGI